MILTLAFTTGFQQTIGRKIFSFWGHIRVQHFEPDKVAIAEEMAIQKNDTVISIARKNPAVKTVEAFATKNALLRTSETIEGILLKGVEKTYDFANLQQFLKQGRWLNFPDSGYSNDILLSEQTASELKLKVNDPILIYFIQKFKFRIPDP